VNFFAAQEQARKATKRLVAVYAAATALIVAGVTLITGAALFGFTDAGYGLTAGEFIHRQAPLLTGIAAMTALFIGGATLFKIAALSSGGGRVARDLGGTLVAADSSDPLRQRLRNVVEEMAIASGVPAPEIYVLEHEDGINAFAAGFTPADAVVAVTRGALETLERDELQGVIAHEFSHILNGDMRLNIRLMGVLFGILALGLLGRMLLHSGRHASFVSVRRNRVAPVVIVIGLGLVILGAIGVFSARVIKAGVSRQREYLADASAVQFTRQTTGLANALKKIGGYKPGSYLRTADPEEISHMLFGTGSRLRGLFATHPPLTERILALDPSFRPEDYPSVQRFAPDMAADARPAEAAGFTTRTTNLTAADIVGSVGHPGEFQIALAEQIRGSIPAELYAAAHSPERADLLTIALLLDPRGRVLEGQFNAVMQAIDERRAKLVYSYYRQFSSAPREFRLPLLEIAFPALRQRSSEQLAALLELSRHLIEVDGEIDLNEYCFYRMLRAAIENAVHPTQRPRRRAGRAAVRGAALELIALVAREGHAGDESALAAYRAGAATFGDWAADAGFEAGQRFDAGRLDAILDTLAALNPAGREMLVRAVGAVVMHDRELQTAETELLRAVCAALGCPLPPFGTQTPVATS